jgi:hypothetical protein
MATTTITVADLIRFLSQFPDHLEVFTRNPAANYFGPLDTFSFEKRHLRQLADGEVGLVHFFDHPAPTDRPVLVYFA